MTKETVVSRARDELFSHINRCGVLQAGEDDQRHWMDETIDYLAERYPDLSDADLQDLYAVGMRFCKPAIPHGRSRYGYQGPAAKAAPQPAPDAEAEELVPQEVTSENTQPES